MDSIVAELGQFLLEGPLIRKEPSYLDLRSNKMNYKVGFPLTTDRQQCRPSLLMEDSNCPDYALASSAVQVEFDFGNLVEGEKVSIDHRICDHITELAL